MSEEQPELDLRLKAVEPKRHRGEGETGGGGERKEVDPSAVTWRRVHTTEKCHTCIAEQAMRLGRGEPASAAWPASYVRTEGGRREALCFTHAAPRRAAEGLRAQRPNGPQPGDGKPKRRADSYE